VDPRSGHLRVVCHDDQALWTVDPATGKCSRTPLGPQPEGNFARATNVELVFGELGDKASYGSSQKICNTATEVQAPK
jgi:hypothetical protein